MMLKEKCSTTDAEWEERQKTRQLEIEACSKALAVLRSDDAHDLFTKTFNPAFVQKESSAPALLAQIAKKVGNPRLATLASQVKLDAFTRVRKAIDYGEQMFQARRSINQQRLQGQVCAQGRE